MTAGPKGFLWYRGKTPGYTQVVKAYASLLKLRRRRCQPSERADAFVGRAVPAGSSYGPRLGSAPGRTPSGREREMATKDTGGQDRASRRSEEVEEAEAEDDPATSRSGSAS